MSCRAAISLCLVFILLIACSWTHRFQVENVSSETATVEHELASAK